MRKSKKTSKNMNATQKRKVFLALMMDFSSN